MEVVQVTRRREIPDHVPRELVHPIGLTEGPEFLAAPHQFMAGLHDTHPPIFYSTSEQGNNAWMLTKYDDVCHVLTHPKIFSTQGATPFPRDPNDYFYMIPLEINPPEHRKYRALIDPMLTKAAVGDLQATIGRLANHLIDQFVATGACEFTTEFGRPLPVSVFLDLMGLPQQMRDTFVGWAMGLLHSQDRKIAQQCMGETVAYLRKVIEEKTATPDESLLSAIIHGKKDDAPLTRQDIFGFTFFLFIAGLDTVFATLNNAFLWLARNPDRRREISAHPDRIDRVVEELLRVFSVTFSGRTVTEDYQLGAVRLRKGERVTCILPAANYDPAVFENPKQVNFHRPRKPVLAFGGGVHSCMGAHLARLEMRLCITEFLRRIPDFQVAEGARIEYWPGGVVGPKTVPLSW
jgi:cytochrome P450